MCPCGNPHPHVHMLSNDMTDTVRHYDVCPTCGNNVLASACGWCGTQLRESRG